MLLRRSFALSALVLAAAAPLGAQAYAYPALQPSRIADREYNFVLGDGGASGTALVFQWREGLGNPKLQFTLDAGFADPDGAAAATRLLIGGGLAYQFTTASAEMPFDIVFTGGLGVSTGDDLTLIRVPFGAVVGHRFDLEGDFVISPFVHPRLSWNRASFGGASASDTELEVDIGASFEVNARMAVRMAATMGDSDAIGLSFAWTPRGVKK